MLAVPALLQCMTQRRELAGSRNLIASRSKCLARLSVCKGLRGSIVQDLLKMISKPPDPELQAILQGVESDMASRVEALKTRRAATLMSNFLRKTNPALASALIDDRDQVSVPWQTKDLCCATSQSVVGRGCAAKLLGGKLKYRNVHRFLLPRWRLKLQHVELQVMVDNLRQLEKRVVAVVGLAHLDGIEARWRAGS